MKIAICTSLSFAKEVLELEKQLISLGHDVTLPIDTESFLSNERTSDWISSEDISFQYISDEMRSYYSTIENSDAILITNYSKNGIDGYVGGGTLMELAVAFYLNKKIFILNPLPSSEQLRYVQEIQLTLPIILDGDLTKIL